jgi:hypothetical protein
LDYHFYTASDSCYRSFCHVSLQCSFSNLRHFHWTELTEHLLSWVVENNWELVL